MKLTSIFSSIGQGTSALQLFIRENGQGAIETSYVPKTEIHITGDLVVCDNTGVIFRITQGLKQNPEISPNGNGVENTTAVQVQEPSLQVVSPEKIETPPSFSYPSASTVFNSNGNKIGLFAKKIIGLLKTPPEGQIKDLHGKSIGSEEFTEHELTELLSSALTSKSKSNVAAQLGFNESVRKFVKLNFDPWRKHFLDWFSRNKKHNFSLALLQDEEIKELLNPTRPSKKAS